MFYFWKTSPLLRKLTWVIVLKLALITAIWWIFIRDQRVVVEPDTVAGHLLAPLHSPLVKE